MKKLKRIGEISIWICEGIITYLFFTNRFKGKFANVVMLLIFLQYPIQRYIKFKKNRELKYEREKEI